MTAWPIVRLGEVVDFYSGGTPSKANPAYWAGDVPWFSAKDMKRLRLTKSQDRVSEAVFSKTPLRRLPAGTVVLVVRGMILAHTVPISILDVDAAINQDLKALLPRRELDPTFLAAMLRAQHGHLLAQVSTAAHGTKKLDSRVLEQIQIPLPAIEEQRRIATILDQADALRAKRREALTLVDSLTQSIFIDMFGDDRTEPVPLSAVVKDMQGGKSLVADDPHAQTRHRVLKISAVTSNHFRPHESKPVPDEHVPDPAHFVRPGDLLISRANTTELVGALAYVWETPDNVLLPDKLWRFRWKNPDDVDPLYVWALFRSAAVRRELSSRSSGTGGSMKNISKAKLMQMPVAWAAPDDQRRFGDAVRRLRSIESSQRQASDGVENLFTALQARAFSGRL